MLNKYSVLEGFGIYDQLWNNSMLYCCLKKRLTGMLLLDLHSGILGEHGGIMCDGGKLNLAWKHARQYPCSRYYLSRRPVNIFHFSCMCMACVLLEVNPSLVVIMNKDIIISGQFCLGTCFYSLETYL